MDNSKLLWKNLKQTVLPPKPNIDIPTFLRDPETANDHFLKLPGEGNTDISILTYYEFHRFHDKTFSLKPINDITVLKYISDIQTNSQGTDNIMLDMIKLTFPHTTTAITSLVNKSILCNLS